MNLELRWTPFMKLFGREVRRFLKVMVQTLVTPFVTSSLYLLIFGVSLGSQLDFGGGHSYLSFLIPGLVMMGCLNNAFQNTSSSIVSSKFGGDLEDFKTSPLSLNQMIWAFSLGGVVRGILVALITLLVGELFHYYQFGLGLGIQHPLLFVYFLFVGGLCFAQLGLSVAFWAQTFDQLAAVSTFILAPLLYLGGVFFSVQNLHPFWQKMALFNPLLYMVNGVRYAILGQGDVPLQLSVAVSLTGLLLSYILAFFVLKRASFARW